MRQKAFTLVEVMIVVGIIAMLGTIAVTSFKKSTTTAKMQTCISNLRHIDMAMRQWELDTKQADNAPVAAADILPYLQGTVVCPSGGKTFADSYIITTLNVKPTCLKLPLTHKLPEDTTQ